MEAVLKRFKLLFVFVFAITALAQAQPVIQRATVSNTVSDAHFQALRTLGLPRYLDTTAANLTKGVDSCGALIYTYSGNKLWKRNCNPKKWEEIGAGGGASVGTLQQVTDQGASTTHILSVAGMNIGGNEIQSSTQQIYFKNSTTSSHVSFTMPLIHTIDIGNDSSEANRQLWWPDEDGMIATRKWVREGGFSSVSSSSGASEGVSPQTSVVSDQSSGSERYDGFPVTAVIGDTVWIFWKRAADHVSEGPLMFKKSWDGGRSYTEEDTLSVGGVNISCAALTAQAIRGRIIVTYQDDELYTTVKFAYSDNGFATTGVASTTLTGTAGYVFSTWGEVVEVVQDTLIHPLYEFKTTATVGSKARVAVSYDNGATWAFGPDIRVVSGATTFPTGRTTEVMIAKVGQGATAATTRLIAIMRNEDYGHFTHAKTSDFLSGWTEDVTNLFYEFGSSTQARPVSIIVKDSVVYYVTGNRGALSGGIANEGIDYVTAASPTAAFNNTQTYSKTKRIYYAANNNLAANTDFGYTETDIYKGEIFVTAYDASPRYQDSASIGDRKERIFRMKLLGNSFTEAFNSTNQSITDSLETKVLFPVMRLDGEGWMQYDSEVATAGADLICPKDGFYTITLQVTFESSASGSYREASLKTFYPGGDVTSGHAYRTIGKVTIPGHATIAGFNSITVVAQAEIKAGQYLRAFVMHDATSALNIVNSSAETRARITIKGSTNN